MAQLTHTRLRPRQELAEAGRRAGKLEAGGGVALLAQRVSRLGRDESLGSECPEMNEVSSNLNLGNEDHASVTCLYVAF